MVHRTRLATVPAAVRIVWVTVWVGVGGCVPSDDGGAQVGSSSGGDASGGPPESGGLELSLFNVIRGDPDPAFSPLPQRMHRVEMPPWVTLLAVAPDGVGSVVFDIDGTEVTDSEAPFLWSEADGAATAWELGFGRHDVRVTAYEDSRGRGDVVAETELSFEISAAGMDPDFEPLALYQNTTWVFTNIDDVMEPFTLDSRAVEDGEMPYRLFTPPDYDDSVAYPLLVHLHGGGPRGDDNRRDIFFFSRLFSGSRSIVSPNAQAQFPSFVLVPQCGDVPENLEWGHWVGSGDPNPDPGLGSDGSYLQHEDPFPSALMVQELIARVSDDFNIDPRRIYLTGESMGGLGTWDFTTRWPDTYAAAVPMAGYSDPRTADRLVELPLWVFHGEADESNPVQGSRNMVEAVREAGGTVRYTEYPDVAHVPSFEMAWNEEEELLPWIYAHRRTADDGEP